MQKLSRGLVGLAIGSSVLVAVAMAASGGWGPFGEGGVLDPGACFFIYVILVQLIFIWFIVCLLRCDEEDRICTLHCVHRYVIVMSIVNLLLLLCLLGNWLS